LVIDQALKNRQNTTWFGEPHSWNMMGRTAKVPRNPDESPMKAGKT